MSRTPSAERCARTRPGCAPILAVAVTVAACGDGAGGGGGAGDAPGGGAATSTVAGPSTSSGDGGASTTSTGAGAASSTSTGDGGASTTSSTSAGGDGVGGAGGVGGHANAGGAAGVGGDANAGGSGGAGGLGGAGGVDGAGGLGGAGGGASVCQPGMVEPCYDGPGGTAGVGACTAGTRTCADDGSGFGACIGQVLPGAEDCTTLADENCDGSVQGCTDGHRWSRQFPGPRGQYVVAVATDADASVVVGGQFEATIDLGGGVLAASAPIDQDGFLGKLDAAGNHLWSLRFGDHGRECALSVTVDGAGDVLATGYFQSPTSFGGNTLQHVFGSDVFLVKLGPAGNHLWSRRYGSTGEQIGHEVATDAAGNVYLVGAADGPIDLGGGNLTGTGSNDIFVAKIDAGGSHVWSKRFSAPAHQYGRNVAVTPAGDVVILGIGEGTVDFGGGPLVSAGSEDVFMARFDTAGTLVWSRRVGGPAFDTAGDVTFDAQGNVLLAAQFQETIDLGGGPLTSAGSLDVVVAKLDPLGELVWSRRYGGTEREDAFAIAVDGAGDIVLGATSMGVVDFGGGPLAAAGSRDACVVKLDSGGDHVWSQRFGGAGVDHLGGLSIDPLDNIDVGGQFSQTVDFGGGPFMAELGDGYLVQLSP